MAYVLLYTVCLQYRYLHSFADVSGGTSTDMNANEIRFVPLFQVTVITEASKARGNGLKRICSKRFKRK